MFVEHDDVAPGAKGTKKVHSIHRLLESFFLKFYYHVYFSMFIIIIIISIIYCSFGAITYMLHTIF